MFSRIEHNSWVASYRKLPLQCLYLTLVFAAMVITGIRISKIQGQATRSDTLAIVMVSRMRFAATSGHRPQLIVFVHRA